MEETHIVKVIKTEMVTHDVKRFHLEKPKNYNFTQGQATDVSINKPDFKDRKNPFTFTSQPEDNYLEFTIKMYPEHEDGITKHLKDVNKGDELILHEVFGAIHYKDKGVFIAGGAGITPFISILRMLRKKKELKGNTLIFSNKTEKDIILRDEFDKMKDEGLKVIYTLTREKNSKYESGHVDENFLKEHINDFNQHFYICGPIRMVGELQHIVRKLGADSDSVVVET